MGIAILFLDKKLTSWQTERSSTNRAHMARASGHFPPLKPAWELYPSLHAQDHGELNSCHNLINLVPKTGHKQRRKK